MSHASEQALFANEAFYLAFTETDLNAMKELWASDTPLVCIHPGWPLLTDRETIIESWRRILENPKQPGIDFFDAQAKPAAGLVLVSCYERLPGGVCVSTNGFVEEDGQMRMFLHHSGAVHESMAPS